MSKILKAEGMNKCIGCFSCMMVCASVNKQDHSLVKSAIKIKTRGGLKGKFVSIVCLGCKGDIPCVEACPSGALEPREGGGVLLKKDRCIGCKKCVTACIVGAVNFDEVEHKPIICKHCGVCSKFCPHECLRMEDSE